MTATERSTGWRRPLALLRRLYDWTGRRGPRESGTFALALLAFTALLIGVFLVIRWAV